MLRLGTGDSLVAKTFSERSPDLAKTAPVGRLFRSPTVFEDLMKTFTLCNCGWTRTCRAATDGSIAGGDAFGNPP